MEGVARQSLPYVTAQTGFRLKILRPWSPVPRFQVCATVPGSSPLALMAGNPEHQLCLCCSPKQSTSCYAGAPSLGWGHWMERSLQSSYSRGWVGNQHAPSIGLEMALQGDMAIGNCRGQHPTHKDPCSVIARTPPRLPCKR